MKLIIFTYAPAGLGHLRVTDALVESRPAGTPYILLGSLARFTTWAHRFTSLNPFGKYIFLKFQYGLWEDIFTKLYRKFLVLTAGNIYRDLLKIIRENTDKEEFLIVATHFGMAHQMGAVKEKLIKVSGKKITLIVQVTDDTSQHVWCVKGADLTMVPSNLIKKELADYAKTQNIAFKGEVSPYPLSPILAARIPKHKGKRESAFLNTKAEIRVAVPISGAAVGLPYLTILIKKLVKLSKRFEFWVLVKKSPFTDIFVGMLAKVPRVVVVVGNNDSETVNLYELMYQQNLIHLEITKPSEQSFKANLSPRRVGGSILLFTEPLGRQEIDNMKFMERHGLILGSKVGCMPRAIKLSPNPELAAKFIVWALESGKFYKMTKNFHYTQKELDSGEVGSHGAEMFWKVVEKYGTI